MATLESVGGELEVNGSLNVEENDIESTEVSGAFFTGRYTKFPDGTMIAAFYISGFSHTLTWTSATGLKYTTLWNSNIGIGLSEWVDMPISNITIYDDRIASRASQFATATMSPNGDINDPYIVTSYDGDPGTDANSIEMSVIQYGRWK